jgi:mannose-6-phosphate isomerase-like protein (cupin superfamily)
MFAIAKERLSPDILARGEGQVVSLPGATMVFKALSGSGPTDFVVGEFTAEPGFAGPRPHVHRTFEELFYILEGEFDFFLDDRTIRLGPGSFVTVPPGVLHDFRNPGTVPARWLGIAAPGGLERYFAEVRDLAVTGQLTEEAVRQLRLRYDTEEPASIPAGHWAS